MSDLISRSALLEKLIKRYKEIDCGREERNEYMPIHVAIRLSEIANLQSIAIDIEPVDAVPVVHAKWIHDINNLYGCSACLERETMSHKKMKRFCPNCGVKMDGGAEA